MTDLCHNCGHANLAFLYRAPAFDSGFNPAAGQLGLARCQHCGLVNTTGANADEIADTYTTDYYGSGSRKFLPVIEWVVSLGTRLQAKKITRIWRQELSTDKPPTVLDIGCGRGNLLRAFQLMGSSVLGLEREEFPEHDRPGGIVRIGSITDSEYTDRTFDIIILWHVLEHLEKPEELLDCITDHLAKNGLLVIAVPNFSSLQQRLFSKYWFHLDLPRHLVHFESQWLLQRLSVRGYSIRSVNFMDPLQNTYGFIQSALNAIAPRQLNHYYSLLKYGRSRTGGSMTQMIKWSLLSLLLLPFSALDSILGTLLRRGATVQIMAKLERKID